MREKADELFALGHTCTSRWRFEQGAGDGSEVIHKEHYMEAARVDLEDIDSAEMLVLLNGQVSKTGGKHVETGYAIAKGKKVVVVGPVENVFHWSLERFETWDEFKERYLYVKSQRAASGG